ncbi:hypothetical protein [Mycobacterium kiyosense]|uniref:hypothetical protein n=1 Tax=Mycobacterium kiyosense TaxID=2871094 RepID=UPI001EE197C2|nr:hypothetical protein [Mycobacterium sp. 20KCMC460]
MKSVEPEADDETVDVETAQPEDRARRRRRRRPGWKTTVTYAVLPALTMLLAVGAGYLKWQTGVTVQDQAAQSEAVRAATDGTVAILSYRPETVQKDLDAARSRLTGQFLDAYTSLTRAVVIPGAQQKQIAATATVPAAAPVSATATHAVVLVFVNQTVTVGDNTPATSASRVRVILDKDDNHWLISHFDPL